MNEVRTALSTHAVITMNDCEYVVHRALQRDDGELAKKLYEYVVGFPLWGKLVRRAQMKHLLTFTRDLLLFPLCCQMIRENGNADSVGRAKVWRHFAEQCSEGTSEISDATPKDIAAWIPKEVCSRKLETRYCVHRSCKKRFQVVPHSNRSKCRKHHFEEKYPGMVTKKTGLGLK